MENDTTQTAKNSFEIDFTIDREGLIHIKESFPVSGEIAIHREMFSGFVDTLRDFLDRLEGGQTPPETP